MKAFMDKDFLLSSETSQKLFHEYAENMPIVDYHCHINPQEIAEDRKFENITQVWLGGDHYKWRQMRSNGVDEYYITGGASDREKFQKWAETLEKAIGNPLYHWSHLELQRYFGYTGHLCGETAEEVWNLCNAKLQEDGMSVRNLIRQSNVKLICTTDDPVDSLEWHKKLAEDDTFEVKVLPAWRPDKAMNLEKPEYADYIKTLSEVSGIEVKDFASMKEAILNRMDFFDSMGCCVSDHALEYVMYAPASEEDMMIIMGNLLENAMEASMKCQIEERRIELTIQQINEIVFLDVKNSISDTVNLNGFQSQKADKIMHGWGIKNIKQIVDENHGEMQCACKDGMFDVNIIFMEDKEYE